MLTVTAAALLATAAAAAPAAAGASADDGAAQAPDYAKLKSSLYELANSSQLRVRQAVADDFDASRRGVGNAPEKCVRVRPPVARVGLGRVLQIEDHEIDARRSSCLEAEGLVKGGVGCVDRASVGVFLLAVGLESKSEVTNWRTRRN